MVVEAGRAGARPGRQALTIDTPSPSLFAQQAPPRTLALGLSLSAGPRPLPIPLCPERALGAGEPVPPLASLRKEGELSLEPQARKVDLPAPPMPTRTAAATAAVRLAISSISAFAFATLSTARFPASRCISLYACAVAPSCLQRD